MVASPHPTELLKLLDPDRIVDGDRNIFCTHYIRCLDEAVSTNWASWTCAQCTLSKTALRSWPDASTHA